MSYELLDRMVKREEPKGRVWVYDSSPTTAAQGTLGRGASIGKLAESAGPQGVAEDYFHDTVGSSMARATILMTKTSTRRVSRACAAAVAFFAVLRLPGFAAEISPGTTSPTGSAAVLALRAVDDLLSAWLHGDETKGAAVMSPRLRSALNDPLWIQQFFHGQSSPKHAAFSVSEPFVIDEGRYQFTVELSELAVGSPSGTVYRSRIEVVRSGHEWLVDSLPRSAEE